MQLSDVISIVAVLLGAIVSLYLALISGDYAIAVVVGLTLPILAALITWLTEGKKSLIGAALVVGCAVIVIAGLTTYKERNSLNAYLESIELRNEKYSKRQYPPLPMTTANGTPIYSDHLSAFRRNKPTLAYLAAPAGAGKSVLIQQMVGKSYSETRRGTVYLQLSDIKEKPNAPRQPAVYGTQAGLGKVPTLSTSDSEDTSLFTMICSSQFRLEKLSEQITKQWPFSRRTSEANQRRFAEVCRDRLEAETESEAGLRIFIDDADEIEEESLLQLMTLIDREIQFSPVTNHRNLLIILAGRPEVLYTSSRERRSLWDESRQAGASFFLLTATIERMPLDSPFFERYMHSCMNFTLEDKDDATRNKIIANVNDTLPRSKNLQESMGYLEGCRFVASHFLNLYERNEPFSDITFAKDFYNSWRDRAYEKHRLPSIEQSNEYENMLRAAAVELDQEEAEAKFHVGLRVLLYSGLVDVIPVRFASREYRIKFQFSQFRTAVLQPPWKQRSSGQKILVKS